MWNNDPRQTYLCVDAWPDLTQKVFFNLASPAKLGCVCTCDLLSRRLEKQHSFDTPMPSSFFFLHVAGVHHRGACFPREIGGFQILTCRTAASVFSRSFCFERSRAKLKYLSDDVKKDPGLVEPEGSLPATGRPGLFKATMKPL